MKGNPRIRQFRMGGVVGPKAPLVFRFVYCSLTKGKTHTQLRWFHELPLGSLPLLRAAAAAAQVRCCSATGAVLETWSEQWRAATGEVISATKDGLDMGKRGIGNR